MKENWFLRYKLHHLLFWFVYNYSWWAIADNDLLMPFYSIFATPYAVKFIFYMVFPALGTYLNIYYLIPRFLEKGHYAAYLTFLALTVIASAMLITPGYYLTSYVSGRSMDDLFGVGSHTFYDTCKGGPLSSTLAAMTLAMSIKLAKNWLDTQRRQQLLEKEKLETELNFLKYQFNPHFLFNTINSIFFLIHKNPDMASASLAKFSDILRYQLYECNDEQIMLSKEIACIESSIALERLRQNENMDVQFDVQQDVEEQLGIAPFILMTFVENAFKHVSKHTDRRNWIHINMQVTGQQMIFTINNSRASGDTHHVIDYGGIGLRNVQRRLDLIYPGRHQLDIQQQDDTFNVQLRLYLPVIALQKSA
jgi:two-component system, LytTR family, sensor kinase